MSDYPKNYYYTKEHEWVFPEANQLKVGITDHAQSELGEVVFVELPEIGRELKAGDSACVVESTKAASDVYSPVAGKVVAVNQLLNDDPGLINTDPHADGWMFVLENISEEEVSSLLELKDYLSIIR